MYNQQYSGVCDAYQVPMCAGAYTFFFTPQHCCCRIDVLLVTVSNSLHSSIHSFIIYIYSCFSLSMLIFRKTTNATTIAIEWKFACENIGALARYYLCIVQELHTYAGSGILSRDPWCFSCEGVSSWDRRKSGDIRPKPAIWRPREDEAEMFLFLLSSSRIPCFAAHLCFVPTVLTPTRNKLAAPLGSGREVIAPFRMTISWGCTDKMKRNNRIKPP